MLKSLLSKVREALISVLPVTLIVFLLNLTPLVEFSWEELTVFLISSFFLIVGIGLFNLGADMAMTPMGEHMGAGLARSGKVWLLLIVSFAMGVLITVAEPDLSVLATQVADVIDGTLLIVTVGLGVGLFLLLAVLKILFRKSLSSLLLLLYMVEFALTALVILNGNADFLALAYDSGGVTTGPITVPFIMALGVGIAATIGGRDQKENSFGLIALCSVGPIFAVTLLGITVDGTLSYALPDYGISAHLGEELLPTFFGVVKEVCIALGLVIGLFGIFEKKFLHLPQIKRRKIIVGITYTFLGLVMFLTAVTVGYMPIGFKMGRELAENPPYILVILGFILGAVVVLAEPAVHVLNRQVEEVTDRTVSRKSMTVALSVGVGLSIALSMIRIVFDVNILYYLVPGYILSLALSFFVPGLYTAIAFDSGGVASGPLTSGFILPFAIGACCVLQGESRVLGDAFGVVAMVALTPLITIQLLGFRAVVSKHIRDKAALRKILSSDDEQIIYFM